MQIVRYFDTFAFVRHPFVRLVSTFKDKILDKNYRHWRELVHFDESDPLQVKFIYSEKATKFCKIFTLLLTVCTVVKSKGKFSQNFAAFSEYMNFKGTRCTYLIFVL